MEKFDNHGNEIYPMCEPQPVQLDCKNSECKFNINGSCITIPAISIHNNLATCWTKDMEEE